MQLILTWLNAPLYALVFPENSISSIFSRINPLYLVFPGDCLLEMGMPIGLVSAYQIFQAGVLAFTLSMLGKFESLFNI